MLRFHSALLAFVAAAVLFIAFWTGGPQNDVDFLIAAEDAPAVADQLAEQGLKVDQPPEDWLFKVYTDDDLGTPEIEIEGGAAFLERAEEMGYLIPGAG